MRFTRLANLIRCVLIVRDCHQVYSSGGTMKMMMNAAYENWLGFFASHCHIPESLWGADGLIVARPRYGKSVPYLKGVEYGFYVPPYSEWGEYC